MQFDFFPSRTLTLYLARLFIVRILAVLVMLVLGLAAAAVDRVLSPSSIPATV